MPRDKPVVILRYAPGEANDAIDVRSLSVLVDGVDRTSLFQATAAEAWGPLAADGNGSDPILIGAHALAARICSVRGACAELAAVVTVADEKGQPADPAKRKRNVFDVLLAIAKKILSP